MKIFAKSPWSHLTPLIELEALLWLPELLEFIYPEKIKIKLLLWKKVKKEEHNGRRKVKIEEQSGRN